MGTLVITTNEATSTQTTRRTTTKFLGPTINIMRSMGALAPLT